jgi:hypothetical protein
VTFQLYELDPELTRAEVLDELGRVPDQLKRVVSGMAAEALERPPGPGEWSAFQTLCHIRDAALVYAIRFRWIVFNDSPFLPNYDEDNWVAACRDTPADAPQIVAEIAASRADLVRVLQRLPEEGWLRTGVHEVLGQVQLEPYVRHKLRHEEMHLAQMSAALGAYRA